MSQKLSRKLSQNCSSPANQEPRADFRLTFSTSFYLPSATSCESAKIKQRTGGEIYNINLLYETIKSLPARTAAHGPRSRGGKTATAHGRGATRPVRGV